MKALTSPLSLYSLVVAFLIQPYFVYADWRDVLSGAGAVQQQREENYQRGLEAGVLELKIERMRLENEIRRNQLEQMQKSQSVPQKPPNIDTMDDVANNWYNSLKSWPNNNQDLYWTGVDSRSDIPAFILRCRLANKSSTQITSDSIFLRYGKFIRNFVCNDPIKKEWLEKGVMFRVQFFGSDDKLMGTLVVSNENC